MDLIFINGTHNKDSISKELEDLLSEKKCKVSDLQVIRIEEGNDLNFVMETFENILELSENIFAGLENFKSACIMMDEEIKTELSPIITYLMFMKTTDCDLFEILSTL